MQNAITVRDVLIVLAGMTVTAGLLVAVWMLIDLAADMRRD